jgi:hypothetical protein
MQIPVWRFHSLTDSSYSIATEIASEQKKLCTSSLRTSYLPTLLAEMMSEGFSAWVLISFIESPWPTKVCMIL